MTRISPQQRQASNPAASVWVNANAGSGKTTVLTARVVRLMLAGANPARILCVTFTKAAAANMQDKIFTTLGEWVALAPAALAAAVADMTGEVATPSQLVQARRLFARALETPGGLKIQTIHSFAERLLHQFPFEAGVPARFKPMEEAEANEAMAASVNNVLRAALDAPEDSALRQALAICTADAGEDSFREALKVFVAHLRKHGSGAPERKFNRSPLRAHLNVGLGETVADVERDILDRSPLARESEAIITWLRSGKDTDKKLAAKLARVFNGEGSTPVDLYISCFLKSDGDPQTKMATKGIAEANPAFNELLLAECERVPKLADHRKSVATAQRTEAVLQLADATRQAFEAHKRQHGRLDFNDLIDRAVRLLTSDAAAWVRFKLDQGLDHVLVDEAQDTSPEQWTIIKALTDDFHAGEGARGLILRTMFAVGDEKQSIFGFQGAKPESFSQARTHFQRRIEAFNQEAKRPLLFQSVPLVTSYRTVPAVLDFVDHVFSVQSRFEGLQTEPKPTEHATIRMQQPGLVEVWPLLKAPKVEVVDAAEPVDSTPVHGVKVQLAKRIAQQIKFWLSTSARIEATGKLINAGDILVLVRNRSAIFHATIRALKEAGLPVAGADRMKLTEALAVQDLLALGRAALLPGDDLTLAELLKSPLFGITEDELLALAYGRNQLSLLARLNSAESVRLTEAAQRLARWSDLAKRLDPFAFYGEILGREGGRRLLLARLGAEAAEAIDVFMVRLRQWQAAHPPSLLGFLEAMDADDGMVKRDMEEGFGRVRVMTVHGSKGLEAPIVFLADTCDDPLKGGKGAKLLLLDEADPQTAAWLPKKKLRPKIADDARDDEKTLMLAESRRLLYVAMTRAKDRLYICSAVGVNGPPNECWHVMIAEAAGELASRFSEEPDDTGAETVLRWRADSKPAALPTDDQAEHIIHTPISWLHEAAPDEASIEPPLRPSRLVDAAQPLPYADVTVATVASRARGEAIHLLLQHLPEVAAERRADVGGRLLRARFPALAQDVLDQAQREALALLNNPAFATMFDGASVENKARTEVAIAGRVTFRGRDVDVSGRIDRLVVTAQCVLLIDFKTGRPPADPTNVPAGLAQQMNVYRMLLEDIYPAHRVDALIVWTQIPAVVTVPALALD